MRQLLERIVSLIAILCLSPLLAVIAGVALIGNGHPIFFRQERVGIHGQIFTMYKFRTMVVGAEKLHASELEKQLTASPSFLLNNPQDKRVTRTGSFLRRLSLDELPQLLNVLRGDMSLVGPRPMLPEEIEFLEPAQMERFDVLPGMTGWAQVNGRGALGSKAYIEHDLYLVRNFSWRLYTKILFLTPGAVLAGRGAS